MLAALGVSNDHLPAANRDQHGRRYFSSERSLFLPVHVLCTHGDPGAAHSVEGSGEADEWRQDRDVIAVVAGGQPRGLGNGGCRLAPGFVRLPIGGDEFFAHESQFHLSGSPAPRGRSRTTIDLGATVYLVCCMATPSSEKSAGLARLVSTTLFHSWAAPSWSLNSSSSQKALII